MQYIPRSILAVIIVNDIDHVQVPLRKLSQACSTTTNFFRSRTFLRFSNLCYFYT